MMNKKMRVCIVAEGCYPYVIGGVSGWINSMIRSFPNIEFIVLAVVANRSLRGQFQYELPENLTEVYEVYLEDQDWIDKKRKSQYYLSKEEYNEMRNLVMNRKADWNVLFELFRKPFFSINDFLMGDDFFYIVRECYDRKYANSIFSDFLWTMRSIYLPLCFVMKTDVPKADLYHCVATGYAGVLGSMAQHFHGSGLLISEHGIYTREREEELIKADWVHGIYKNIWIEQFKKMSLMAYERADIVTSLYQRARDLQIELGCPKDKIRITPNGIDVDRLTNMPGKSEEERKWIYAGAVLRVTPIKDVKTMIQSFAFAKKKVPELKLWIMGPTDEDEKYARECFELVDMLGVKDVEFTGRVDVRDYLGKMDFTLLTSISEGQPLTILESYAAHCPVIATDVGNCRELIYGPTDSFGSAGILTHIMNLEEIAQAMIDLAQNKKMRECMGEAGYKRVQAFYRIDQMKAVYKEIYQEFAEKQGQSWSEEPFDLKLEQEQDK